MKNTVRILFHIDLNAFFASVEMIENPSLKKKVFAVGGGLGFQRGGILTTASYKARRYGIHSAMTVSNALRLYPKLIVVPTRHSLYEVYSQKFIEYLKTYSDLVLQASIDEAYVDMTEYSKKMHPLEIAKKIQRELKSLYQLPCSIGIAPTLFLSKMASDLKKPMGITVLRKRDIEAKLLPLPIETMFGIGKKTYPKLQKLGILTIGDFKNPQNKDTILKIMSENSYYGYLLQIEGKSSNIVDPSKYAKPKSISTETTLPYDTDVMSMISDTLKELGRDLVKRLHHEHMKTKTIGIRLRYHQFETIQKVKTIGEYTDDLSLIESTLSELLEETYNETPLRLIGAQLSNLELIEAIKTPYNLFTYQEEK